MSRKTRRSFESRSTEIRSVFSSAASGSSHRTKADAERAENAENAGGPLLKDTDRATTSVEKWALRGIVWVIRA